jgi:hypothetical protein
LKSSGFKVKGRPIKKLGIIHDIPHETWLQLKEDQRPGETLGDVIRRQREEVEGFKRFLEARKDDPHIRKIKEEFEEKCADLLKDYDDEYSDS